jgi:hypothetical protein
MDYLVGIISDIVCHLFMTGMIDNILFACIRWIMDYLEGIIHQRQMDYMEVHACS